MNHIITLLMTNLTREIATSAATVLSSRTNVEKSTLTWVKYGRVLLKSQKSFRDYLNPKKVSFWADEISRFHKTVPVDGLWIDMNEISNFCTGKCSISKHGPCPGVIPWLCCLDCVNITNMHWDEPPYKINCSGNSATLGYKTIATSSVHYNGVLEYDAHSLYGFSKTIATHAALKNLLNKRPFVLSLSTFVGSGSYGAHWTATTRPHGRI